MHGGCDKQWEMQNLFFAIRVKNKHGQKWNRLRDILRRSSQALDTVPLKPLERKPCPTAPVALIHTLIDNF